MKITIIGTASMGRDIGTRAIAGAHRSAAFGGEIVVFAVYYPGRRLREGDAMEER
jgi:ABC-type dipeptide/oligopeptide/nickel transport system permease subunit